MRSGSIRVSNSTRDLLRFTYSSMTTPEETYDYDMRTRSARAAQATGNPLGPRSQKLRDAALLRDCAATAKAFRSRCCIAPISRPDGAGAPLLLYGYGAYGHSLSASFNEDALSLVDRGFVYALAHMRGGTDKGWRWYEDGKLEKKTNTFSDFIACARHLVATGYTREGAIVAQGASRRRHADGRRRQ